jgi:ABC-2 type transport system ATP-binding protein
MMREADAGRGGGRTVLELVDVSRRFRDVVALDGISFSAPQGQMVGFVGPNGAGKTTAMRIVLGVLEADGGEVLWRGRPVDADARRRFGYMPEERGLYPKMRVLDQLVYLGRLHGLDEREAPAAARRCVEVLGVAERARDPVQQLSLGNQQRVQLAAALVHAPELLVLDEPFSGLDPVGVDVLTAVLREQVAAGVPAVFSSHQLELVERICDAVVLIANGRVVASGPIEELRSRGDRRLVRLEVAGASHGWEELIPGAPVLERFTGGAVFELEPGTSPDAVLDAARAVGTVTTFSVVRPSLTEIFREAVAE